MAGKHKCPVCGKFEFESYNSLEMCDVCGWSDDAIQEENQNYKGGGNEMNLKEAVEAYKNGEKIY